PVADANVTYNVYSYTTPAVNDAKKLNTDPINGSSFMVENLTNGTPYRFGVTAVIGGVESAVAVPEVGRATGSAFTPGIVVPNAPVLGGFSLYNIGTETPGTLTVTGADLASASLHM